MRDAPAAAPARRLLDVLAAASSAGEEPREQAESAGLVGRERAPGDQQVQRAARADQAGQALGAAVAGQQAQRDLRRAER